MRLGSKVLIRVIWYGDISHGKQYQSRGVHLFRRTLRNVERATRAEPTRIAFIGGTPRSLMSILFIVHFFI